VQEFFENKNNKCNSNGCKSDYARKKLPTIRHLTRIMNYLLDCKQHCNITNISTNCGLLSETTNKSILWLVNHKIVERKYENSYKVYFINQKWKKLKDGK